MARSICAACEMPISNGQQVTTAGTEVFHRSCVGGAAGSVRSRLERKVNDLTAEVSRLATKHAYEEARNQRTTAALKATEAELARQGEQLRVFNAELMDSAAETSQLRRELEVANANALSLRARAETAEAALDSIARTAASRSTVPDEKQERADQVDPAAQRARLLEIE